MEVNDPKRRIENSINIVIIIRLNWFDFFFSSCSLSWNLPPSTFIATGCTILIIIFVGFMLLSSDPPFLSRATLSLIHCDVNCLVITNDFLHQLLNSLLLLRCVELIYVGKELACQTINWGIWWVHIKTAELDINFISRRDTWFKKKKVLEHLYHNIYLATCDSNYLRFRAINIIKIRDEKSEHLYINVSLYLFKERKKDVTMTILSIPYR